MKTQPLSKVLSKNKAWLAFLVYLIFSCSPKLQKDSEQVLFTIDDESVTKEEFLYVFSKNQNLVNEGINRESIDEYLDLYINFKLKVQEARRAGLDTATSYVNELNTYRKQLAKPYLTETSVTDDLLRVYYSRTKEEVKASHILIRLEDKPSPSDTLKAWEKAKEVMALAKEGKDFNKLALEYSEDPSARFNQGDLGFFTTRQFIKAFEDAAYEASIGQLSGPVRTRYGYHIIQTTDRRPSVGQVRVAHIMIADAAIREGNSKEKGLEKINSIHQKLKQGDDWDKLCLQFSDDNGSKSKGGEIRAFGKGQVFPEFEEAAFGLNTPGEISEPIRSPQGWHLIRLIEKLPVPEFADARDEIERWLFREGTSSQPKQETLARLKEKFEFSEQEEIKKSALKSFREAKIKSQWEAVDTLAGKAMAHIGSEPLLLSDFSNFFAEEVKQKNSAPNEESWLLNLDKFYLSKLKDFELNWISANNPDYKFLLKEYKEGILLFDIMEQKVWKKALEDSTGLRAYYQQHQEQYRSKRQYCGLVVSMNDSTLTEEIKTRIDQDAPYSQSYDLSVDHREPVEQVQGSDWENLLGMLHEVESNSGKRLILEGKKEAIQYAKEKINYLGNLQENQLISREKGTSGDNILILLREESWAFLEREYNLQGNMRIKVEEGCFDPQNSSWFEGNDIGMGIAVRNRNDLQILYRIDEIMEEEILPFENIKGRVASDYQEHLEKQWVKGLRETYQVEVDSKTLKSIYAKYDQ